MDISNLLLYAWISMWLFLPVTMLLTFQAGRINAARGKPTQQSSPYFPSDRAVDSNDGSHISTCSHTQNTYRTWWSVNLQAVYIVYSVTLTNRDSNENRLSNFTIYASNTNINPTQATDVVICNSQTTGMGRSETKTFDCGNAPIRAQYIIVDKYHTVYQWQPLTLCEVQVEAGKSYLRGCRHNEECLDGSYGVNCAGICGNCIGYTTCSKDNGYCSACAPGYWGNWCTAPCDDGYYNSSCQPCSENCLNSNCYKFTDTGYCVHDMCEPGYMYGRQCDTECIFGTYGDNCSESCSSTCAVALQCDNVNGHCIDGCMSGYYGDYCQNICVNGTYGDRCISNCSPNCHDPVCDKFSDIGRCVEPGCKAGYEGESCLYDCEPGKYGENCIYVCPGHCRSNDICSRFNGSCSGCSVGYIGQTCSQECQEYTYGDRCKYDCSPHCVNPCDKTSETGSCGGQCKQGYKGDNCTQECVEGDKCFSNTEEQNENEPTNTNTPVIIAVVVCTVVLGAIIIITAVVFFFKFRQSPSTNLDNKTQTGDGNKPHVYENATVAYTNQISNREDNQQFPNYENAEINLYEIPDGVDREETPVPSVYETINN